MVSRISVHTVRSDIAQKGAKSRGIELEILPEQEAR